MEVCVCRSVLSDSLRPHGFSVHGILQARILKWVAIPFSKGLFPTQGPMEKQAEITDVTSHPTALSLS